MTISAKLIGALRVNSGTSLWVEEIDGIPITKVEVVIPPGLYYVENNGASTDLLYAIEDAFTSAIGDDLQFDVDSNGIVSHYIGGITSAKISWVLPSGETGGEATDIRNWLRFDSYGDSYTVTTTPLPGDRTHAYGFYPGYYLQVDLRRGQPRVAQFEPDDGNMQTIKIRVREEYEIALRSTGYPRPAASGYTEYHILKDFYAEAMSGRPLRVYPDTTVTTAYSPTNRFGYEEMTMRAAEFFPQPVTAGWYKNMDWSFSAVEYS